MELVKLNVTLDRIVESLHQIDDCALSDSRRSDYRSCLMSLDGEGGSLQDLKSFLRRSWIFEMYVIKLYFIIELKVLSRVAISISYLWSSLYDFKNDSSNCSRI